MYECRNFKFASALTTENMQGCCYCYCKINDVQAVSFYCWNEKSAYDCFLFFFRIHLGRVLTFECLKMKSMFKPNVSFCVPLLLMWVIKNRYYWCSYNKVIYMYRYYRLREIFKIKCTCILIYVLRCTLFVSSKLNKAMSFLGNNSTYV